MVYLRKQNQKSSKALTVATWIIYTLVISRIIKDCCFATSVFAKEGPSDVIILQGEKQEEMVPRTWCSNFLISLNEKNFRKLKITKFFHKFASGVLNLKPLYHIIFILYICLLCPSDSLTVQCFFTVWLTGSVIKKLSSRQSMQEKRHA